jgi:hypothetical protein
MQKINEKNKYLIEITVDGSTYTIHGAYSQDTVDEVGQDNLADEMQKHIAKDIERAFRAVNKKI